jgi:small acid-soluble spore protein F (minor alpha/beta-type SASP)
MAKRKSIMSDQLKYEIARELGLDRIVASQGWGAVSSRDCGNMVTKAIQIAEKSLASQNSHNFR